MIEFADKNNLEIVLAYYPPYHSKYNPVERCWGIVRPQGQLNNRVKVPVGVSHNVVAESNCVIVKWGGEQLEAKRQSVG
jgi:hypothetical protein